MAQKRLDEQFSFTPKTPVYGNLQRLLSALEARFQGLEAQRADFTAAIDELLNVGLTRINETLGPATEKILKLTELGFLVAESVSSMVLSTIGNKTIIITAGDQRDLFAPTAFVAVQRKANFTDWGYAQVIGYDRAIGALTLHFIAIYGSTGPFTDWVISDAPGISEATKYWFDQTVISATAADVSRVAAEAAQVAAENAATVAEAAAGVDVTVLVRRDGSTPFVGIQSGIAPTNGANDASLPTTSWTRGRISEAITALVGGAPGQLDTLAELASALSNDQNFANAMTAALALRVRVDAAQALTAAQQQQGQSNLALMQHGQCRLDVVGVNLKLSRYNGRYLLINGKMEVIPDAGVTVLASTPGLVLSDRHYVYASMSGSTMILSAYNNVVPGIDTTYGNLVAVGNPALTFVGIALYSSAGTFVDTGATRGCASWFNRLPRYATVALTNTNTQSPSPTYAMLTSSRIIIPRFAGDAVSFSAKGQANVSANFASLAVKDPFNMGTVVAALDVVYTGGFNTHFDAGGPDLEATGTPAFVTYGLAGSVSNGADTLSTFNTRLSALYWG